MIKSKKLVLTIFLAVVLVFSVCLIAFSEGLGEYVSGYASGKNNKIPPGQYGIIAKSADEFLSGTPSRTIFASTLVDGIDDPNKADELSDFFLLDIRNAADFKKSHIHGSVFVPFSEVAKPENLAKLPTDKPILIICYTGHTASQANSILNMLGYNAWTLRFGMTSWFNENNTAVYSSSVRQTVYGGDYPVCTEGCIDHCDY